MNKRLVSRRDSEENWGRERHRGSDWLVSMHTGLFQDVSLDATDVWMKRADTIRVGPNAVG